MSISQCDAHSTNQRDLTSPVSGNFAEDDKANTRESLRARLRDESLRARKRAHTSFSVETTTTSEEKGPSEEEEEEVEVEEEEEEEEDYESEPDEVWIRNISQRAEANVALAIGCALADEDHLEAQALILEHVVSKKAKSNAILILRRRQLAQWIQKLREIKDMVGMDKAGNAGEIQGKLDQLCGEMVDIKLVRDGERSICTFKNDRE
uniref:Uncharacterized protein n=1 Tax=Mycena chlorophos TaxID=658473 RepID=A0ABQ0KYN1_MYCCL|nr:predicted protein [Mycena chlorophos]